MGRMTYGDGSLFERKGRGLWVARLELGWDERGERRRWEATSRTKAGALAKLRQARHDISTLGTVPDKGTTLEVWLPRWLEEIAKPTLKPRTYADYKSTISNHLVPRLGKVPLSKLTPGHVRHMHREIQAGTSLGTANKAHRVLRASLSDAEREGLVPRNVAKLVQTPAAKGSRRALTADQARLVVSATTADPMHSRWLAALLTGARQGELLGLQWDRVDLEAGTLDLAWQLQALAYRHGCSSGEPTCGRKRAGSCPKRQLDVPEGFEYQVLRGQMCLTRPKSAAGRRIVPIPTLLVEALAKHRRASIASPKPFGLVWADAAGNPLGPDVDLGGWYAALEVAGVAKVPLHSARHTTATLLMELGVDVTVIQAIMGHSDATTTQLYQHADLTMTRRAVDGLGQALARR